MSTAAKIAGRFAIASLISLVITIVVVAPLAVKTNSTSGSMDFSGTEIFDHKSVDLANDDIVLFAGIERVGEVDENTTFTLFLSPEEPLALADNNINLLLNMTSQELKDLLNENGAKEVSSNWVEDEEWEEFDDEFDNKGPRNKMEETDVSVIRVDGGEFNTLVLVSSAVLVNATTIQFRAVSMPVDTLIYAGVMAGISAILIAITVHIAIVALAIFIISEIVKAHDAYNKRQHMASSHMQTQQTQTPATSETSTTTPYSVAPPKASPQQPSRVSPLTDMHKKLKLPEIILAVLGLAFLPGFFDAGQSFVGIILLGIAAALYFHRYNKRMKIIIMLETYGSLSFERLGQLVNVDDKEDLMELITDISYYGEADIVIAASGTQVMLRKRTGATTATPSAGDPVAQPPVVVMTQTDPTTVAEIRPDDTPAKPVQITDTKMDETKMAPAGSRYCIFCGELVPEESKFCLSCGASLSSK